MPIKDFNSEEFAKNLAKQAIQVVPEAIPAEYKDYIINKVYQFCVLSGNALSQDPNINMSLEQGHGIVQCIGEWTFHKSIDLVNSKIPNELWDLILQKVAFIIFEAGKHTVINNMQPEDSRIFIETQVMKSFKEAIQELIETGKLDEKLAQTALTQSNIDKMVEEGKVEVPEENQRKNVKLAAFALLMKNRSDDEIATILSKMDSNDASIIEEYLKIPDLETKVDPKLLAKYMHELSALLEETNPLQDEDPIVDATETEYIEQMKELSALYSSSEIEYTIRYERDKIQKYVNFCTKENFEKYSNFQISLYMEKIIYEYIKSKLTA